MNLETVNSKYIVMTFKYEVKEVIDLIYEKYFYCYIDISKFQRSEELSHVPKIDFYQNFATD